jgi:hypothetical protein
MLALSAIPVLLAFACGVNAQAPNWGQCGGMNFTGPTKCNPGEWDSASDGSPKY